jgi:hypothetical protein
MAGHVHIWQEVRMADGAVARLCLCGSYRVIFAAELPRRVDPFTPEVLDLLEAEGTAEVPDA